MSLNDHHCERLADNPRAMEMCLRVHREHEAELASIPAIDAETAAAIEQLRQEEQEIDQLLRTGELSVAAGVELKLALLDRTPRHVLIADTKLSRTMCEALASPASELPNA